MLKRLESFAGFVRVRSDDQYVSNESPHPRFDLEASSKWMVLACYYDQSKQTG
jgi:hypothetical protein